MQEILQNLYLADKILDTIPVKGNEVFSLASARSYLKRAFDALEKLENERKEEADVLGSERSPGDE